MADKPTYEELEQRVKTLESDLAANKRQNDAVLLREQYLQAILDNTNLPIYLKDADYRYILINPGYERLAQVTNDQVRGKDDFAIFPEPIAQLFRKQDVEVTQRKALVEFTETVQLADGEHTFLTAKFPIIDSKGSVYAIGGVCTDITSLQKTKKNLKQSEEKYRTLVETSSLGIQISDREGRIILSNPAHHKIYGLPEGQIAGRYIWNFIDDETKKRNCRSTINTSLRINLHLSRILRATRPLTAETSISRLTGIICGMKMKSPTPCVRSSTT